MRCFRLFIICSLTLLSTYLTTQAEHQTEAVRQDSIPDSIKQILELPEKKIDIGIAALTFAKEVYPDLDIKAYSRKIDKLVKGAIAFTEENAEGKNKIADPEYKKLALNTYLFREYKLEYDLTDPYAEKPENRFINGVLDRKRGSCVTMPMLYMAIAQRMGYPVYPVATPDHWFLRYVDTKLKKQNIEATSNGGYSPDAVLIEELEISDEGIKSGAYLRTLTYREYIAALLSMNGIYWAKKGDLEKARKYLEKSTDINPKDANSLDSLSAVLHEMSLHARTSLDAELFQDDAVWYHDIAKRLGLVNISHEGQEKYAEHVKKKLEAKNKKKRKDAQ